MNASNSNRSGESEGLCYILSIDGGGFRGTFAAHVLRRMEQEWQVPWLRAFNMLAGTSTGSILAAGLAKGFPAERLADFYTLYGSAIFTPRLRARLDFFKVFTSRYSSQLLKEILEKEFDSTTLGEINIPLIIPSVDIGNGSVHVFKSNYSDFLRDPNVRLSDAVLASCSAPTYFDPQWIDDKYQLVDGGLWANNPALVAVVDAKYRLGVSLENMRVLSIGTGKSKTVYPRSIGKWKDLIIKKWQGWGFVTRWERSKLLDLILNLQSDTAHNTLCLLMGESPLDSKKICRITFESDLALPMDATSKLDDWISIADRSFTHNSDRIAQFLKLDEVKS